MTVLLQIDVCYDLPSGGSVNGSRPPQRGRAEKFFPKHPYRHRFTDDISLGTWPHDCRYYYRGCRHLK